MTNTVVFRIHGIHGVVWVQELEAGLWLHGTPFCTVGDSLMVYGGRAGNMSSSIEPTSGKQQCMVMVLLLRLTPLLLLLPPEMVINVPHRWSKQEHESTANISSAGPLLSALLKSMTQHSEHICAQCIDPHPNPAPRTLNTNSMLVLAPATRPGRVREPRLRFLESAAGGITGLRCET